MNIKSFLLINRADVTGSSLLGKVTKIINKSRSKINHPDRRGLIYLNHINSEHFSHLSINSEQTGNSHAVLEINIKFPPFRLTIV